MEMVAKNRKFARRKYVTGHSPGAFSGNPALFDGFSGNISGQFLIMVRQDVL